MADAIPLDALVNIADYRLKERTAKGKEDPLRIIVAYGQASLIFAHNGSLQPCSNEEYILTSELERVNKFAKIYREDAPLLLHYTLADIMVDAAIFLRDTQGWYTVLWDGLRTMEAAEALAESRPDLVASGLLSSPGTSAHQRGMAIDSTHYTQTGIEVDMGGHFDHTDMEIVHRNYSGNRISDAAKRHRVIRECAYQRAALQHGLALAPLRKEYWDDRFPEYTADLWRVLESIGRCCGISVLFNADEQLIDSHHTLLLEAPRETWAYAHFAQAWEYVFSQHKEALVTLLGTAAPPPEHSIIYHGNYASVWNRDLPLHLRQI